MSNKSVELLCTPIGDYTLSRIPSNPQGNLRAWDAADELIINTLFQDYSNHLKQDGNSRILIVNDAFGALTLALHDFAIDNWSDSYLAHLATKENLKANHCSVKEETIQLIPSTRDLDSKYCVVLIKIPKTLSLLEDQLSRLKSYISKDTVLIAAAMTKYIHTSTLKLFEKIIGTTTTSLANKKARLIFAKNDAKSIQVSPYPTVIKDQETGLHLFNHANVFAQDKLDIGTRFFINHLHLCPQAKRIVDLGCGNGTLGIKVQQLQTDAKISFADESYNAITSAKASYSFAFPEKRNNRPDFLIDHALSDFLVNIKLGKQAQPQLILCNPPFHQGQSIGDQIAWDMFTQSHKTLETGGELWIIGNRHLGYHIKLKNIFGHYKTIVSNNKFVILATKKIGND